MALFITPVLEVNMRTKFPMPAVTITTLKEMPPGCHISAPTL